MSYFNMIQLVESSGIGLVYGLRFYSTGQLDDLDIVSYVKTNALLYEYYKQAYEQMPLDIGDELVKLFNSEAFIIVNTRYVINFNKQNHLGLVAVIIHNTYSKLLFAALLRFYPMWKRLEMTEEQGNTMKVQSHSWNH